MIKLTNAQLNSFNSPTLTALFNDTARQFPVEDAFRILDIVQALEAKLKTYNTVVKQLVTKYAGTPLPNGGIKCKDTEDREALQNAINELNVVEIEIPNNKVKMSPAWPTLTLAEASILRLIADADIEK